MSRAAVLSCAAALLAACATPAPDPYATQSADAHAMSPYQVHEACAKLAEATASTGASSRSRRSTSTSITADRPS